MLTTETIPTLGQVLTVAVDGDRHIAPTLPRVPGLLWVMLSRCACGNPATEAGGTCEWCIPHDHDTPESPHVFSWPYVICAYCHLMAQDCCENASECPGKPRRSSWLH